MRMVPYTQAQRGCSVLNQQNLAEVLPSMRGISRCAQAAEVCCCHLVRVLSSWHRTEQGWSTRADTLGSSVRGRSPHEAVELTCHEHQAIGSVYFSTD